MCLGMQCQGGPGAHRQRAMGKATSSVCALYTASASIVPTSWNSVRMSMSDARSQ